MAIGAFVVFFNQCMWQVPPLMKAAREPDNKGTEDWQNMLALTTFYDIVVLTRMFRSHWC